MSVFVKMPMGSDAEGFYHMQFYRLELHADDRSFTAWPLPSYGLLQIGSRSKPNTEWPEGLRVVRKAKELRQCQEWADKADNRGRMKFLCERKGERVEVQNMVGHYLGQFHTHSLAEFSEWKANAIAGGSQEQDFTLVGFEN